MKAVKSATTPKRTIKYILLVFALDIIIFFIIPEVHYFILPKVAKSAGYMLSAMEILLIIWACINLRKSISPFPTPIAKTELITVGVFKYIRHPIYSGLILFLLGCKK